MKIDVLTLFPEMVEKALSYSIPARAVEKGLVEINTKFLRDFAIDNRGTVDDTPYGGGPGMILRVDVTHQALESVDPDHKAYRIMLTPDGNIFNQKMAKDLSIKEHIVILCGRYEGFDSRIDNYIDEKVSIGEYVLSGGEIPTLVIIDTVVRLIPGVLGNEESLHSETFEDDKTDYPQFTRPPKYLDKEVPEILLSGNHQEIAKWRSDTKKDIQK